VAGFTEVDSRSAISVQVIGVIIGPLAFGADLLLSYLLVHHACSTGHYYVLHAITVVCLLIVLGAAWMSWQQYLPVRDANDSGGSARDRTHFLALFGTISSLFFAVVIIANAVPRWILSPCD
jgi:hypothetical protein